MKTRLSDPYKNLKLQVCIVDNGRLGNSYVGLISMSRVPKKGQEDPLTEAFEDSRGIPPVIALIATGGVTAEKCIVLESHLAQPTDALMTLVKNNFPRGVNCADTLRFILVPLGMSNAPNFVNTELLAQINHDLKKSTMNYYDFENGQNPRLNLLGKIELPNPERYCEFTPGVDFTPEEETYLQEQRAKSSVCMSHGQHPTAKFELKMMELTSPPKVASVRYLKQSGDMVNLPVEKFEAKLARARGIANFSFTSRIRLSVLWNDFNEDKLPPPAWKFGFGGHSALSAQHDFHCFYNPEHPSLKACGIQKIGLEDLIRPMPPVYFAHIGAMDSYGVFAAQDLPGGSLIDVYAGDVIDDHRNPLSLSYSFLLHSPGHMFSNNQAVYAFDSGNTPPLINSAPTLTKANAATPGVKANVVATHSLYKKMPAIFYYVKPGVTITKDTQLFVDYETLLEAECPRHFSFFAKGTAICAAAKNNDYCKEDHAKGREHYAKKEFSAAKKSLKTAYHLMKANYEQLPTAEAAKLRLTFATICEDMADTYRNLDNMPKAIHYMNEALALRKGLAKQTQPNEQRILFIQNKLHKLQEGQTASKKM